MNFKRIAVCVGLVLLMAALATAAPTRGVPGATTREYFSFAYGQTMSPSASIARPALDPAIARITPGVPRFDGVRAAGGLSRQCGAESVDTVLSVFSTSAGGVAGSTKGA